MNRLRKPGSERSGDPDLPWIRCFAREQRRSGASLALRSRLGGKTIRVSVYVELGVGLSRLSETLGAIKKATAEAVT
jgi:hypothetical protein